VKTSSVSLFKHLNTSASLSVIGSVCVGFRFFLELSQSFSFADLHQSILSALPITQIFVTLNSVQISMNFTYLDTIVDTYAPLPAYQTATGRADSTSPISGVGTYSLIIQAQATNGAIYNYQTTIIAHT
jgi:hypothetical protein